VLYTASSFISFYGRLEDKASNFYESLVNDERFIDVKDIFVQLLKENRNHKKRILRSYQEVITDALEAAFPKKYLEEKDYDFDTVITDKLSFSDIIKKAIDIEEKSYRFCKDVGESLGSLLADVPETFIWVARRKIQRKQRLESLIASH
jgi:hypothetical protein